MRFLRYAVIVLLVSSGLYAQESSKGQTSDLLGSLTEAHIYKNSVLGMTLTLPGTWELLPGTAKKAASDPSCRGPLCGGPEIDVALQTKSGADTLYRVFLAGYKLSPSYQDRKRYPLQRFAQIMLVGSIQGSGLIPIGPQEAIRLDGVPAYRLLAGHPNDEIPRAAGYVADANGYIFMLVVASPSNPAPVKAAIEKMALHSAADTNANR